jgi:hypothetical protein
MAEVTRPASMGHGGQRGLVMAVGHSDDVDPGDAIAVAVEQCRDGLGEASPQAGILFSGFDSFEPHIVPTVREAFPGVNIMGATSAAEISSDGYEEDSITLALFASDLVDVTVGLGAGLGSDVDAACQAAAEQALAGTTRDPRICVLVTETFIVDPQRTLEAMARSLPPDVVILGGTSARNDFATVSPTFQFCNDRVVEDGVAIMLFSGPVEYSAAVGTGWTTLGSRGRVTRSEYGAIHEIDGRPAQEFLARSITVTGPATYGNPLAVFEAGTEEFYLRAIQPSDPSSGSITVGGSVPVGSWVQLTTADTEEILAGTDGALRRARQAFPAGATPEAALIFSCAVRKFLLGSRTRQEADLARSVLGAGFPMAGLYCYGEVGPVKGAPTSRFLNETFVTLLLGT